MDLHHTETGDCSTQTQSTHNRVTCVCWWLTVDVWSVTRRKTSVYRPQCWRTRDGITAGYMRVLSTRLLINAKEPSRSSEGSSLWPSDTWNLTIKTLSKDSRGKIGNGESFITIGAQRFSHWKFPRETSEGALLIDFPVLLIKLLSFSHNPL